MTEEVAEKKKVKCDRCGHEYPIDVMWALYKEYEPSRLSAKKPLMKSVKAKKKRGYKEHVVLLWQVICDLCIGEGERRGE